MQFIATKILDGLLQVVNIWLDIFDEMDGQILEWFGPSRRYKLQIFDEIVCVIMWAGIFVLCLDQKLISNHTLEFRL